MPAWVKARGMSYYLVAFQGSNAIGALVLGGVAQASSVATALAVIAATLLVVAAADLASEVPRTKRRRAAERGTPAAAGDPDR